jgi:kinesin family protein 1
VIHLSKANVTPSPDVEALLGVGHPLSIDISPHPRATLTFQHRFAFTVFTPTNSYVLQAANQKELDDWMKVIITSAE